ncbi:hypothetical protein U1839_24960, partial [Sphingomonas sp. RT2P30]
MREDWPGALLFLTSLAKCLDRRQGGHLFGDMVDGFDDVLSQVDLRQNMSAIAEIEDAIGVGGA